MAENTGLYLTAMVGIVAVVAVIILTMNAGSLSLVNDGTGDLSGQAVKIAPKNQFNQMVTDKSFLQTVKQRGLLDDLVRNGLVQDLVTEGFVIDVGGMFDPGFSFDFRTDVEPGCTGENDCSSCEGRYCSPGDGNPGGDPEDCADQSDSEWKCEQIGLFCICERRSGGSGYNDNFNNQFTPAFLDQLENMQNYAPTFEQYLAIEELLDYGNR